MRAPALCADQVYYACTQVIPFPCTLADRGSGRAASACGGDGTYDRCGVDRSRRNYWVRAECGCGPMDPACVPALALLWSLLCCGL